MLYDILIPFIAIGLAELGDKTQLAVFCLASKTKKCLQLFFGVMLALIIADGIAILLGSYITTLVPQSVIKIIAGAIFITVGIVILLNNKKEEAKCELKMPFMSGFSLILISEMGDKTQIAAGLFATKFNPFLAFFGVILALTILSLMAVYLGKFVVTKLEKKTVSIIAGILFILIGILIFL